MKISTRLALGIGVLLVLIAYSSIHAIWHSGQVNNSFAEVDRMARNRFNVNKLMNVIFQARIDLLTDILINEKNRSQNAQRKFEEMEKYFVFLDKNARNPERRAYIAEIHKLAGDYKALFQNILEMRHTQTDGASDAMRNKLSEAKAVGAKISELGEKIMESYNASTENLIKGHNDLTSHVFIYSILLGLLSLFLAVWVGYSTYKAVAHPIIDMTRAMESLAKGNLAVAIPATAQKGEIGAMARSIQIFKDNAVQIEKLKAEREEILAKAAAERAEALLKMKEQFDVSLKEMQNVISASPAAAQVDIGDQVVETAKMAALASEKAERTNEIIRILSQAVGKISDIVILINEISSQTEMLALSARVESEFSGDSEGFSIASRANVLANRAARATWEIGDQVKTIQDETSRAVEAIKDVGEAISDLRKISSSLAETVEKHGPAA